MESSINGAAPHEKDSSQCVRVAVNIRPLITTELLNGCSDCITVIPGEPQVSLPLVLPGSVVGNQLPSLGLNCDFVLILDR